MKTLIKRLAEIQKTLNAPKGQTNTFGGYKYRSCEDILMAVKPLLGDLVITVNDEMSLVGDRVYVKATATITDGEHSVSTSSFAREAISKKGMDDAQVTGSTSSYARKYALNGLLLIDDNKDADHADNRSEGSHTNKGLQESSIVDHITAINDAKNGKELKDAYAKAEEAAANDSAALGRFIEAFNAKKAKALAASNASQA